MSFRANQTVGPTETILQIKCTEQPDDEEKKMVLLVLDISPSMMDNNALNQLKNKIADDVIPLVPESTGLAIIVFAETADVLFVSETMGAHDKDAAQLRVRNINCKHRTNICAGLNLAQLTAKTYHTHKIKVLFLTDGQPNCGELCMVSNYESYQHVMKWPNKETLHALAAKTCAFSDFHLMLFGYESCADLAQVVKGLGHTVSVSQDVAALKEQFASIASTFSSDSTVTVKVMAGALSDEASAQAVDERQSSMQRLIAGETMLITDPVSQISILWNGKTFQCTMERRTLFELSGAEAKEYDMNVKMQRALEKLNGLNNSMAAKVDELLVKEEKENPTGGDLLQRMNDLKVDPTDEWVTVSNFELEQIKGALSEVYEVSSDAPVYRSLVAQLEDVEETLKLLTEQDKQALPKNPGDAPVKPLPTEDDVISRKVTKAPRSDDKCRYRSLSSVDMAVNVEYTSSYRLVEEQFDRDYKAWLERNTAYLAIQAENKAAGRFKAQRIAALALRH